MAVLTSLTSVWHFITNVFILRACWGFGTCFSMQIIFWVLMLAATPAIAQTVYLSPSEALKTIFHSSGSITPDKKVVDKAGKPLLEKKLGGALSRENWTFHVARTGSKIDGYAVIDQEVGKTEPITFMTALDAQGKVIAVEILVYREPYGSEVHQKSFLRQYKGKTLKDPVRAGQDIKHISGATISSHSVSRGVKRALILWDYFYGNKK